MMPIRFVSFLLSALLGGAALAAPPMVGPNKSDRAAIKRAFRRMNGGAREENELRYKSGWYPQGYETNFVGGRAGMSGRDFYRQAARRRWLLRPKLEQARALAGHTGGPYVIPCLIWSPVRRKAIATVYALLIRNKKFQRWQMLGGGGRRADVEALGRRYINGKPLAVRRRR